MEQKKSEDNQISLIGTGPCSRVFADSVVVKGEWSANGWRLKKK